jgi:prepilin-type N-terminal cleavage/methylation domain-containing protein
MTTCAQRPQREDGFTLLEVIVSITLFVIMATSTALVLTGNIRSSRLTNQRVKAASIAQSMLDAIKPGTTLPTTLPTTGPDGYVVRISLNPSTATCTIGTTRKVSILVYAPNSSGTGTPLARTDSVVSC